MFGLSPLGTCSSMAAHVTVVFLLCSGCCCGTATNAPIVITWKCPPISSSGQRWLTAPGWRAGEVPLSSTGGSASTLSDIADPGFKENKC